MERRNRATAEQEESKGGGGNGIPKSRRLFQQTDEKLDVDTKAAIFVK